MSQEVDRTRFLIEAARTEQAPTGARDRVLVKMGISAGVTLAAASAAASKVGGLAAGTKSAAITLLLKALGVGALVGVAAMAVVSARQSVKSASPATQPSREYRAIPEGSLLLPAASVPQPPPSPAEEPPKAERAAPRPYGESGVGAAAPRETSSALPEPARAEQIAAERALLDSAAEALVRGRASTALKQVDEYEARFGSGILSQEQVVLKVRALIALGRRADAVKLGERYLSERPHGTHAKTIERLLSDQNSERRP